MKAVVLESDLSYSVKNVEMEALKPDHVRIEVKATGVCGSDLARFKSGARKYPIVLGHEFSGKVSSVGTEVKGVNLGQKVTAAPLVPCHTCSSCLKGYHAHCKSYSFIGSRVDGALGSFVDVPAENLVVLPESLDFVSGAFIEPLTVVLHALRMIAYAPGQRTVILGMGTIGLLALQAAKAMGASEVVVIDIVEEQLEVAKKLGADRVVNSMDREALSAFLDSEGSSFKYVLDCAGAPPTIQLSLKLVEGAGTVQFIGTPTGNVVLTPEEFEQINRKEMTVTGSWMSYSAPYPGWEWSEAARMLSNGSVQIDELIGVKTNLEGLVGAVSDRLQGVGSGKIIAEV